MKFIDIIKEEDQRQRAKKIFPGLKKGIIDISDFSVIITKHNKKLKRYNNIEYILPNPFFIGISQISNEATISIAEKKILYYGITEDGQREEVRFINDFMKSRMIKRIERRFAKFNILALFHQGDPEKEIYNLDENFFKEQDKKKKLIDRAKIIFKGLQKGYLNFGKAENPGLYDNENGEFIIKYDLPQIQSIAQYEEMDPSCDENTVFIRLHKDLVKLYVTLYWKNSEKEESLLDTINTDTRNYYLDWIKKNFRKFNIHIVWLDKPL
jgi:hypothetical protein